MQKFDELLDPLTMRFTQAITGGYPQVRKRNRTSFLYDPKGVLLAYMNGRPPNSSKFLMYFIIPSIDTTALHWWNPNEIVLQKSIRVGLKQVLENLKRP